MCRKALDVLPGKTADGLRTVRGPWFLWFKGGSVPWNLQTTQSLNLKYQHSTEEFLFWDTVYFRDICIDNSKSWLLFQNLCKKLCGNPKHPSSISSGEVGCVWAKNQKFFLWTQDRFLLFNLEMTSSRRLEPPKKLMVMDSPKLLKLSMRFFPAYHRVRFKCHGLGGTLNSSHTGGLTCTETTWGFGLWKEVWGKGWKGRVEKTVKVGYNKKRP